MNWITERAMPASTGELSALLAGRRDGPRWMPQGGGTLLGRGALPSEPVALIDLSRCRSVIEHAHDDLTVTALAGLPMAELGRVLGEKNQWLPLSIDPDPRSTIGGWIGADRRTPLVGGFGSIRDYLLGMAYMDGEGRILRAGGRVVKNVAGYDLMKLFTGSLGQLGIIVEATFKVLPRPARWGALLFEEPEPTDIRTALESAPQLFPAALWRLGTSQGEALALVFAGSDRRVAAQVARAHALCPREGRALEHEETLELVASLERDTRPGGVHVAWGGALPEFLSRSRLGSLLGGRWTADLLRGHFWARMNGKETFSRDAHYVFAEGEGHVNVDAPSAHPLAEPWGTEAEDADLLRRLKLALDPGGRFVHGRWPSRT